MDNWRQNLSPVQSFFHTGDDVQSDDEAVPFEEQLQTSIGGAQRPIFKIPKRPPKQWNSHQMIRRVKVGVMVELSTIPLYLYAMYSLKSTNDANDTLRDILNQEMLHLALVGNLLTALGGSLDLYDSRVVPRYPGHVLLDDIPMTLRPLGTKSLTYFIQIESPNRNAPGCPCRVPGHFGCPCQTRGTLDCLCQAPASGAPDCPCQLPGIPGCPCRVQEDHGTLDCSCKVPGMPNPPPSSDNIAPEYKSIGDLYEDVIKGVDSLTDKDFTKKRDSRFTEDDFFGDQLSAITDKKTALRALRLIIEQGEGNTDSKDSHFHAFSTLKKKKNSDPNAWEVHPVPKDPQTAKYDSGSYTHKLSLAFDAAYCYLLQNIQRVWRTSRTSEKPVRDALIRNMDDVMRDVLTPLAEILIKQPWGNGVAAPCFNYYAMIGDVGADLVSSANPLNPEELHKQMRNRLQDALNAAVDEQQKSKLREIKGSADNCKPSEV